MTYEEFHDCYRHPHGTMGRKMSTMRGFCAEPSDRHAEARLGADAVRCDGNPSWAQDDDGALAARLGAFRHTCATPVKAVHGDAPTFLGPREIWWPTRTHFHRAVDADPAAWETLLGRAGKATNMLVQAERYI